MNLCIVIWVLFSYLKITETSNHTRVDFTLRCAEYIRCRADLMKQQWRCGEGTRKLMGRTCRLGTHFNVFKRTSHRYETDLAQCITREAAIRFQTSHKDNIPEDCSSAIPEKNEGIDCLMSLNASIKRCEAIRGCCPLIDECQSNNTPLLLTLKEKRADLIKGALHCRTRMSAVLKTQMTADDEAVASAILRSSDDVAKMVAPFGEATKDYIRLVSRDAVPVSSTSTRKNLTQVYHNQSENTRNISGRTTKIQKVGHKRKNLINPPILEPFLLEISHVNQTILKNGSNPEHKFERGMIQINDMLNITNRTQNLLKTAATNPLHTFGLKPLKIRGIDNDSDKKLERLKSLMHEEEKRNFSVYGVHPHLYPLRTVDNETNGTATVVKYPRRTSFKKYQGRFRTQIKQGKSWLPGSMETERKQAVKLVEGGSSDTLPTMDMTSQKSIVIKYGQTTFSTPTSLLFPSTQIRRKFSQTLPIRKASSRREPSIRKSWSNKTQAISRKNNGENQFYSSRKVNNMFTGSFPIKKYGVMKPWRTPSVRPLRTDSLYNNEVHFPNNTDRLTDIAIPYRNRATARRPMSKSGEVPKLLLVKQNVSRTVASYQPLIKVLSNPQKFHRMSPEAIYEDIITQEQLVQYNNNPEGYLERNESFEDFDSELEKVGDSLVTFGENALPLPRKKSKESKKHHAKSGGSRFDFDSKEMEAVINNSGTWTMEPIELGATDVVQVTERNKYLSKNPSSSVSSATDDPLQGFVEEGRLSFSPIDSNYIDGLQNESNEKKEYLDISADNLTSEIFYNKIVTASDIPLQSKYMQTVDSEDKKIFSSDNKIITTTLHHTFPNHLPTQHTIVSHISDLTNSSSFPSYDDSFSVEVIPLPISSSSLSSEIFSIDDDSKAERLPNPATVKYWGQQLTPSPSLTTASPFSDQLWPLPIAQNRAKQHGLKTFTGQLPRHIDEALGNYILKDKANIVSDKYQTSGVFKKFNNSTLTHCKLYKLCLYDLQQQEKICEDNKREGRLVPGLPRRRVGLCNRRLVPHYQELDAGFRQLEADFRECVEKAISAENIQDLVLSSPCFLPFPSLPPFSPSESCSQKLSVIKKQCSKLAICCPVAQRCRSEIDQSPLGRHTRERRVMLYEAAAKCQIKSYREYKKQIKDRGSSVRNVL